jgi:O-antigen/teichoic acid export membrane protein
VSRLRVNLLANFAGTGWSALLQIICVPFYIKILGIEAYGLVGFFITLQAALRILDVGLTPTLNREMARYSVQPEKSAEMRDLVRSLEIGYWTAGILVGIAVATSARLISTHWINVGQLQDGDVHVTVLVMAGIIAVQWPLGLYQGGLMGLQRQVLLNTIKIITTTLSSGGAIFVLLFVSRTIAAFFIWQLAISVLQVCLTTAALWRCLPQVDRSPRVDFGLLRSLLKFAGGMSGIGLFGVILAQMDKILLSKLLPLKAFGYYTLAGVVASGLQLFVAPVFGSIFPRMSALVAAENERGISALYHDGTQVLAVLVIPFAIVTILFSAQVLQIWTGDAAIADKAAPVVVWLVAGSALNGLMCMPYVLQLAHGWTSIGLSITVGMCVLFVPAIYVIATRYGAPGAAMVWFSLNLLYVLIGVPFTHRRLLKGEAWQWLSKDIGIPLVVSFTVGISARYFIALPVSRIAAAACLAAVFLGIFLSTAASAPRIRMWLFAQIRSKSRIHV